MTQIHFRFSIRHISGTALVAVVVGLVIAITVTITAMTGDHQRPVAELAPSAQLANQASPVVGLLRF